jgi:nicotinamide-nucleotide amidase
LTARPRALVLCTGSELVRGEIADRNGPFLARALDSLGLEPARVTIVGDRPEDLEAALRESVEADVCCVSGGLGPTHDDRTVELVARVLGRPLLVDAALEEEIGAVSRSVAERLGRRYAEFRPGVTKQATVIEGAHVLGLAGTAPGLLIEHGHGRVVVVLPGPPPELQRLWPRALEAEPMRRLLARAAPPARRLLRFYGTSESALARALEHAGGEGDGVEVTICARDFEVQVDVLAEPGAEARADALAARLREPVEEFLFAEDERRIEEIVLDLCRARGLTLGTAESCTGGLVAARLTSVPGASDVFLGGIVSYANDVKRDALGVPDAVLRSHGAVSAQAAAAMAVGARERLGVGVAVAVTGVAGPGGGTPEKPVGLVHLQAAGPDGTLAQELNVPGDREAIRARAAAIALHLVRRLLSQS